MKLILFRREHCGLCELAEQMLVEVGVSAERCYLEDDIGHEERYGWRIPVVRREDTDTELDWPFDAWKLRSFLE